MWIGEQGGHVEQGFGTGNLLRRVAHGEAVKKRSCGGVLTAAVALDGWQSPGESYSTGADRGG
jgi:hypothetical protein